MSFEERNTVIYLVVSLIVAAVFGSRIWAETVAGGFSGAGGLVTWARTVLWMVPAAVALTIVAVIAGQILYAAITGERDFDTSSDERDTAIAARAARITMALFSLGWLGAIVLIAMNYTVLAALNLMLLAGWGADLVGNLVKLRIYRRGSLL